MSGNPRALAVECINEALAGARRPDAISRDPRFLKLSSRDRRLALRLCFGVLRRLSRLDFYVNRLSRRPLSRLDPAVLSILRVALYQLESLRIPAAAAVDEAVKLCRVFRKSSAAGFVNAVLRSFLRQKPPLPEGNEAPQLSIRFSHPEWLVSRYLRRYGLEGALALMERNNSIPRPALWVNPHKADFHEFLGWLKEENISCRVIPDLPNCIEAPASLARHRLYREGYCFLMDSGSQRVVQQIDLAGSRTIGDFCAAPGGKSFLLAARLSQEARLFCCDASKSRLRQMKRRTQLCKIPGIQLVQADLTAPAPFRPLFDLVIVDVPCSGLGTLGSNPDIRWKIKETALPRHQLRQAAILKNGFSALRPGGRVVYSTCSTEPEENEAVVEAFLKQEPRAALIGDFQRNFPEGRGQCFFWAEVGHAV